MKESAGQRSPFLPVFPDVSFTCRLIRLALDEDLSGGDITSNTAIPEGTQAIGVVLAKEKFRVCGGALLNLLKEEGKFDFGVTLHHQDGADLNAGDEIATLRGCARDILAAERTALNFLQRLSGVATHTRWHVERAKNILLLDTRKTTPGWRYLEKYAVKVGGGHNHRFSLSDMIMIKNNHIDLHDGNIDALFERLSNLKPRYTPIQCEVRNIAELRRVLPWNPQSILLDNMSDAQIEECLKIVQGASEPRPLIEVSGGINEARFSGLASLGISAVSLGCLTTQARNVDISLRVELLP